MAALRSRVKHSTTEPLRSLDILMGAFKLLLKSILGVESINITSLSREHVTHALYKRYMTMSCICLSLIKFMLCYVMLKANTVLIVVLYFSMISVSANNFDDAKEKSSRQLFILS